MEKGQRQRVIESDLSLGARTRREGCGLTHPGPLIAESHLHRFRASICRRRFLGEPLC